MLYLVFAAVDALSWVAETVVALAMFSLQTFVALYGVLEQFFKLLVYKALPVLVQAFSSVWFAVVNFISSVCYAVVYGAQQGIPAIVYAFSTIRNLLVQFFLTLWYILESGAKQGVPAVLQFLSTVWNGITSGVIQIVPAIFRAVSTVWYAVVPVIAQVFSSLWSAVVYMVTAVSNGFVLFCQSVGALLQAIVTLNWSQLPGYIGAIFSTTSTLFMYALTSVYQGILYTLYGWYIIAGYILLALASIVSSVVKVITYIFYPIVWVVDTLFPTIIEGFNALLERSDFFMLYLRYRWAFIFIFTLFFVFVLPWLLRKGLVVLRKSVRIFMHIQVRVRLTVRVLCRRLLGVVIPVRNVRNRAANIVPAGVNQPRDEPGGGGGHRAAVRIPRLREERELFEQRGEVIRAPRTPRERGEAIERMEREACRQRRGGAMQRRVPRETETGAGNQVRNVAGREARERREAAGVRRRFVPQEPDYPDEWLPIGHALQRERDVIENRERIRRERRRSGHEMIEHDTDMESWGVAMRDPERAREVQAEWERNGGGLAVRNGRDNSRDGPVYHGHGARDGRDYTQRINRHLERNGDSPASLPPRQPNSVRNGRDYTQRINRYLEQNGDSLPPLQPRQFNDVSTLQGGSKQSDIFNFETPASTKSAISGQGDMALKTKLEELEKKLLKEEESKQCVVCMDQPRELMIRPCNHYCVCQSCARRLQKCPMCNRLINRAERVYNV